MSISAKFTLAATLASALLAVATAQAHARLVSADPAADSATVTPKTIELHFSEAIAKRFSHFTLAAADGASRSLAAVTVKDDKTLVASPAVTLAPGRYTISWVAVATDDGHKTSGSYHFTVK